MLDVGAVILLLTTYIKTPIRYSEEEAFYKTPYNPVYYYLYLLLLISVCYYGYTMALQNAINT